MKNLTPAMRQYIETKEANPDSIIFFRMGDFYEMFFDDARLAARVLGITLTARDREKKIPMCGVPYHAASSYIAKLVKEGYKVAVCDQVEDPKEAKGVVKREVTRVITPGLTFDDEILDPDANNYIAAAYINSGRCGFSYMDASTGEFRLTEVSAEKDLVDEIARIRPLELLVAETEKTFLNASAIGIKKVTQTPKYDFVEKVATDRICKQFGITSIDGLGLRDMPEGVRAAGALLSYINDTQKSALGHIKSLTPYFTHDYLVVDSTTRRNLEINNNLRTGGKEGTLLGLLDRTRTAAGARMLKSWLLHPLKDVPAIKSRLDAVGELIEERNVRDELRELLKGVYDLERLTARVSLATAGPRDMVSLKDSLARIPAIKETLSALSSPMFHHIKSSLTESPEIVDLIEKSIADSPPAYIRNGGVIREGFSSDLDNLRRIGSGGKDNIARLEAAERERTGINTLKVGYNKVFGYYIEITKTNLDNVPTDYIRKQTLVGAERFITPALKEWEEKVLTAEEKARVLETELFCDVRSRVGEDAEVILRDAELLSTVDVLASLATVGQEMNYTRPEVNSSHDLLIEGGRHPVIEATSEDFVPNDLALEPETMQIVVLTGPNMAGKSTYLRQNALIVLMAQIGSYVPASTASIGVVDRIFTRIGASDDLSRGQSTFMVEMNETANILNNATPRSLIILDEIGRGTSTFDGLSIAWSVVEYIHDHPKLAGMAKTLFATHYHELTELSLTKERVKNYNMAVRQWEDQIIFLRKVVPGGCSSSYGIQVARLAGLPERVIERANTILRNLESSELSSTGLPRLATGKDVGGDTLGVPLQMNLLGEKDPVREELEGIDVMKTTPLEALTLIQRLKDLIKEKK